MLEAGPVEVPARVVEALPGALYKVELEAQGRRHVTVHVSAEAGLLRILPGEGVVVALSPYDATRGRIVRRLA